MNRHTFTSTSRTRGDGESSEWIVLNGLEADDLEWLESSSGLDNVVKKILSAAPTQNQRLHREAAILMSLVRTDAAHDDLVGLTLLIEARRIICVSYGVENIVEELLAGHPDKDSVSRLIPLLVIAFVQPLETEIRRFSNAIEDLEDRVMELDNEQHDEAVVRTGRQVLSVRRYLAPRRDELTFLALNPEELCAVAETTYLRRAEEYLSRLVGSLDSSHNRVTLLLNYLRNRDEARLSRSMHKLAIVATVFLPLSFITGLLGINVAGIPEAHDPKAFWFVCAFLVGVAIVAVLLIGWRRWR